MATRSFFTILNGDKFSSVQGWQVSPHFACQLEKDHGYRITHMPTGFLLTDIGFSTVETAKSFAELCETVFGGHLTRVDVHTLNDLTKADPACKSLYADINKINELAKTKPVISETELSELTKEFSGKQK